MRTFNNQSHEMKGILFHADYTLAKINEDDICSNFKTKYEGVLMDESEDDICNKHFVRVAELKILHLMSASVLFFPPCFRLRLRLRLRPCIFPFFQNFENFHVPTVVKYCIV